MVPTSGGVWTPLSSVPSTAQSRRTPPLRVQTAPKQPQQLRNFPQASKSLGGAGVCPGPQGAACGLCGQGSSLVPQGHARQLPQTHRVVWCELVKGAPSRGSMIRAQAASGPSAVSVGCAGRAQLQGLHSKMPAATFAGDRRKPEGTRPQRGSLEVGVLNATRIIKSTGVRRRELTRCVFRGV